MPEFKDDHSDGNESAHSLDNEYGGLEVHITRTPRAKKAFTTTNEQLCCSTLEMNVVSPATMTIWHIIMPL